VQGGQIDTLLPFSVGDLIVPGKSLERLCFRLRLLGMGQHGFP
jgi:hypothetical protein